MKLLYTILGVVGCLLVAAIWAFKDKIPGLRNVPVHFASILPLPFALPMPCLCVAVRVPCLCHTIALPMHCPARQANRQAMAVRRKDECCKERDWLPAQGRN